MKERLLKLLKFSPFKAGVLVAVSVVGLFYAQLHLPLFDRAVRSIDNRAVDLMFLARGAQKTSGQVAIVDIDEKSLASKELSQWPWPRNKFALILRKIHSAGPRVIGLDIVFAEPDRTSIKNYLPAIGKRIGSAVKSNPETDDNDVILGQAVSDTRTVLGFFFQMDNDGMPIGELCPLFPQVEVSENKSPNLTKAYRPVLNVQVIEDKAAEQWLPGGFFNAEPDDAAMVRRVPILVNWNDAIFSSLAASMLTVGLGAEKIEVPVSEQGAFAIKIADKEVYVDASARVFPNYRGPSGPKAGTFPYYSAIDVLKGKIPAEKFKGKYILIGTSAHGLKDLRATPFTVDGPGVEIHANIIDNFLLGDALRHDPNFELVVMLLVVLVGGTLLSLILARAGALWGGVAALVFILITTAGNYYTFFLNGQIIGVTWPLITVLAISLTVTLANFFTEGAQKRVLRGAFSKMVSPHVVSNLIKDPKGLSLTGEEKQLSIMFADIRNFTGISEQLEPHAICELLNDFLTEMTDLIQGFTGTVDKFIGDEIMSFWGAPLDDEQHATDAVRAGLAMRARVKELAVIWKELGRPTFDMGVGINSGLARVGMMGSKNRLNYTAIGDNVNLAARLQGLNKAYGTGMIISQPTLELLPEEFLVRPVDVVRVVGRKQPVMIFEPLAVDRSDPQMVLEAEVFEKAFRRYRQRRFAEAREFLEGLQAMRPDKFFEIYIERMKHLEEDPPPKDWDGVYEFKSK